MKNTCLAEWNNAAAREAVQRYEGLVRAQARRLVGAAVHAAALDEEDLRAEGRIAVLEALGSYEGYGVAERTWVATRVRQRMIDAIRKMDIRTRAEVRLAVKHAAGETENAEEHERGRRIAARRVVSLHASGPDREPLTARIKDAKVQPADEVTDARRLHQRTLAAMKELPPRQRQALSLGIFEGLRLREIAGRMGISESRVCQLQKRAVAQLKIRLGTEAAIAAA